MNVIKPASLFFTVLVLSSCAQEDPVNVYSMDTMNNFVNSCAAGGNITKSQCQCVLTEIQKQYTEEEYAAIEFGMMGGNGVPEKFTQVMAKARASC